MDSPVAQAVLLGVMQGLTEFLPVSSSGHLALAQQLIPGFKQPGVLLDVLLHLGTLLAVVAYFGRELFGLLRSSFQLLRRMELGEVEREEEARFLLGIIIASVPTALIGLMLEERVEALFSSMLGVGVGLLVTAGFLVLGELIAKKTPTRPSGPGFWSSLLIGVAQGIAVVPGVSRSGATISTARMLGVPGEKAARFSFLLSLPAVAGAALLSILHEAKAIRNFSGEEFLAYLLGPVCAGVVGYAAIEAMMRVMKKGKLVWFAPYCGVLGVLALVFAVIK